MRGDSTIRIAVFTLVGAGRLNEASGAWMSACPIVDRHVIVDTAPEGSAWSRVVPPGLLGVRLWPWRDDFAAAVNAGLGFAAETEADWAMRLDSDERVICANHTSLRAFLSNLPPHVIVALVHHEDGSHTRERFFRIPCSLRFKGRTHETFPATLDQQVIIPPDIIRWSELPKSPEQLRAKFERDIPMLRADIVDDPKNGAAHYYLGSSLQSLGRYEEALEAFREHHRIDGWEGGAWSCYRAAECNLALHRPDRALDCVAAGLVRDAGIGELYWIGGVASLLAGRVEQARCWAEAAKAHGMGSEAERRRRGFRVVQGLTTGPQEVLDAVAQMSNSRA